MSRRNAPRTPLNSAGKPWQPGQRWYCTDCGLSGDDRDDMPLSDCPKVPALSRPHFGMQFEPPSHAIAVAARQGARGGR